MFLELTPAGGNPVVFGPFDFIESKEQQIIVHEGDRQTAILGKVPNVGLGFVAEPFEDGQATREWLGRSEFDALVGAAIVAWKVAAE